MANPLPHEKEIYEKIAREKLTIPDPIWELLNHHLGNDLYAIFAIAGSYIAGDDKEAIPPHEGEKIIKHGESIKVLMNKLKEVTGYKKDV